MKVVGRDHLPDDGRYVIGFNHPGYIDPIYVAAAHRKPLYMLGRKEEFERRVTGRVLHMFRMLPLDRGGGDNQWALDEAVERLQAGEPFALAPEGTRSDFGPLGRGRSGLVRMALAANVPVVPCAVIRKQGRLKVIFGSPIQLPHWDGCHEDRLHVREQTNRVMGAIAGLLGEPYDPETAPDHAARRGFRRPEGGPRSHRAGGQHEGDGERHRRTEDERVVRD